MYDFHHRFIYFTFNYIMHRVAKLVSLQKKKRRKVPRDRIFLRILKEKKKLFLERKCFGKNMKPKYFPLIFFFLSIINIKGNYASIYFYIYICVIHL